MSQRPNILLIMTDQQRGDCLGIDGHPCLQTPNMDALAAGGVRFRSAYTSCPVCIPARRSLLSGLHPQQHGMVGYADGQEWEPPATLPQLLRDAGYHTGLVGRNMHQYPHWKRFGYEEMVVAGETFNSDYKEFLNRHLPEAGGYYGSGVMNNDWTARPWHMPEHLHQTHWTVNEALRFLNRRDPSRPWFLTVSFIAPHPPFIPPQFYFDRYLRCELPAPLMGNWAQKPEFPGGAPSVDASRVDLQGEALRSCQAGYYGLINHVDDEIRRLLSQTAKVYDPQNTLVVFTSDHGEMLGDHYFFRKSLPYEGAARIPFLIRQPGSWNNAARGVVSDLPVCLEDIMPTLLEAAEVAVPDGLEGKSLVPTLRGEDHRGWREAVHVEHSGAVYGFHSLAAGKEKYIWFSQSGREQFFDLQNDPNELHDLIASPAHRERIAYWRQELIRRIENRPEGFVAQGQLVAGQTHATLIPRTV